MSPQQLAHLGRTNKAAFFAALRPAAEEAERKYGVPAQIILAQAALETGFGAHLAARHNLFGHKGTGPAGTNRVSTQEWNGSRYITIQANFKAYHDFHEAVLGHGKLYHNGYYEKALRNHKATGSVAGFARDITGVYATDPHYATKLMGLIAKYKL